MDEHWVEIVEALIGGGLMGVLTGAVTTLFTWRAMGKTGGSMSMSNEAVALAPASSQAVTLTLAQPAR